MASERNRHFFETLSRWGRPGDFWVQVGRTIGNVSVDEAQIAVALEAIRSGLELEPDDVVLDLGCGNGALSQRIFEGCRAGVGVDFSAGMIETARRHFEDPPRCEFVLGDVESFVATAPEPERFTKGVCYFTFQYFSPEAAEQILAQLRARFTSMTALYVGDMPDKTRMDRFDQPGTHPPNLEEGHETSTGMWRAPEELVEMAQRAGWDAEIRAMPPAYYAAHYRYDAILRPARMGP